MKGKDIITLSENEYIFLSNKFEIMTATQAKKLPCYIVSKRKNNFEKVVRLAIEEELDKTEQNYINEKYFSLMSVNDIATKYSVSRQSVYRVLDRASAKLFNSLKYVYCCGFTLLNPPENLEEIFSEITRRNEK